MSVIDIVLLVAALLFAITGWRRGLVYGLLSLVGFLTGAAVGLWLAPKLVDSWADGLPKALTALAVVFIFAALGQVLVGMVGRRLQGAVTWGPIGQAQRHRWGRSLCLHHASGRLVPRGGLRHWQLELIGARRASVAGHRRLRLADAVRGVHGHGADRVDVRPDRVPHCLRGARSRTDQNDRRA